MMGRKWPETVRNGGRLHWKPRFHWSVVLEEEEEELYWSIVLESQDCFQPRSFGNLVTG